jgi:hypothetical protein
MKPERCAIVSRDLYFFPISNFVQGTLDFVSLEVELGRYTFLSRLPPIATDISKCVVHQYQVRPFNYNSLHDLESLWWVAMNLIFNHRDRHFAQLSKA